MILRAVRLSLFGCLFAATAHANFGQELFRLGASDAAAESFFGNDVAISGSIGIVGAVRARGTVADEGAAYLFDVSTGQQLFRLAANDPRIFAEFGRAVAIDGNSAIVGKPLDTPGGVGTLLNSGSAYVFDVATGQQRFKLLASDAAGGNRFGSAVAVSGNVAIIGAPLDFRPQPNGTGSAYLFDVTTGQELRKIFSTFPEGGYFGHSVAISGNLAVVGAPLFQHPANTGAAYVFDVTTGQQLRKLTVPAGGQFGISVAISGNIAIIGADLDDVGGTDSGAAYLFDLTTGQQLFKLKASDPAAEDFFGQSVGISGNIAIVGSFWDDDAGDRSGSAYLFDVTTGQQLAKLTASDASALSFFGQGVSISSEFTIAGAPGHALSGSNSGAAYVFVVPEPAGLSWLKLSVLFGLRRGNATYSRRRKA